LWCEDKVEGNVWLGSAKKWRLKSEEMKSPNLNNNKVIFYGECTTPPINFLVNILDAGNAKIVATKPPYEDLENISFAIIGESIDRQHDKWIKEFECRNIKCVPPMYLLELFSQKNCTEHLKQLLH